MRHWRIPVIVFLIAIGSQSFAQIRSVDDYAIQLESVNSSGQDTSSSDEAYKLNDSVSQSAIVGRSQSEDSIYALHHGFWHPSNGVGDDFAPDMAPCSYIGLGGAIGGQAVAWGDLDKDGDWDFILTRNGQDYLYLNQGNGTFIERAIPSGIVESLSNRGVAWADYDGDGRLDLFSCGVGQPGVLWKGGQGTVFADFATTAGLEGCVIGNAACWSDYDGDGLIDLFVASAGGGESHLYRNNGDSRFLRADAEAGLTDLHSGIGIWGDYDNDGKLDLFIAQNNGQGNRLYRNLGNGRFEDVTNAAGLTGSFHSQGPAWGDYNNDGFLDLYIPNSGTEGDVLYCNNRNGTFTDVTLSMGISDAADGRCASWADVNNDGFLDLYVTNSGNQPNILYYNLGNNTFQKQLQSAHASSQGAAWADYDNDGDLDLLLTDAAGAVSLYRNDRDNHHGLNVRPLDANGHFTCFGTQVRIYDAGTTTLLAMRQIDGGHGTGCQDMYDAHFGLDPDHAYDLEIRFTQKIGDSSIIVNKNTNPDLGGIRPCNVDLGYVEVRADGRVRVNKGLVYVSTSSGNEDLWLMNRLGETFDQLTTNTQSDRDPSWSPDANKVVFSSNRGGNYDLYIIGIEDRSQYRLTTTTDCDNTQPAWSPDGNSIAFVSDRDGNKEIYVIDTAGQGARNLSENPAEDTDPAWSPNAGKIAFVSNRSGTNQIYKMNFDGSNVERLTTDTLAINTQPAWSPDGLQIAYTSYRDGYANIYVMNFDGTGVDQLTTGTASNQHPTWSPDGQEIVFQSDRDVNQELYACKADGSGLRRLTTNPANDTTPNYPVAFQNPPRSIVFGLRNGHVAYWADPVNTELGNFTYSNMEFMLPGKGTPLTFIRYYNSQDPLDGPLGYGWRHNFMITAQTSVDGDVILTWGDGHQDMYRHADSGAYVQSDGTTRGDLVMHDGHLRFTTTDSTIHDFDPVGRIASITDKNGESMVLNYAGDDLTNISQSNGRNLTITYDAGRITEISDHAGRHVDFVYDGGDLTSYTNIDGHLYQYTYDAHHRLISVTDPLGNEKVRNEYDANGRVWHQWAEGDAPTTFTTYTYDDLQHQTRIRDRRGDERINQYDENRRLIAVTDPLGRQVRYGYDGAGNRAWVTDRMGQTTRYPTGMGGLAEAKTDPSGNASSITYNESTNNPQSHIDQLDREMSYVYDPAGNLTQVTNPAGGAASVIYNSYGKPTQITDELNHTTHFNYNDSGDLISIKDHLNRETTMSYDSLGRMRTKTDPEGNTVTYNYNANNSLASIADARGGLASFAYDNAGRLISTTTKLNETESAVVHYEYDAAGRVHRRIDPRGFATEYTYDPEGSLKTVTDALGNAATYDYDQMGQLVSVTNPLGAVSGFEYDANGRLIRMFDPLGNPPMQIGYDALGQVTVTTDSLGNASHVEYDAAGQIIQRIDPRDYPTQTIYDSLGRVASVIDPLGHHATYEYDAVGNLIKIHDNVNGTTRTTEYEYNEVYNRTKITNALGDTAEFTYDKNNRLKTKKDPEANITEYFYDAVGHVTDVKDSNGVISVHNEYDLAGRLVKVTDALGNFETYEYDLAGNRTKYTDRNHIVTRWEYDALGRVKRQIDPNGNAMVYDYDRAGRVSKVQRPIDDATTRTVQYGYDLDGRLTSITNPNNQTTHRSYDALGRLAGTIDPLGREERYQYDAVGNLIKYTAADGLVTQYTYDGKGQRTRSDYPDGSHAEYTYDDSDNLIRVVDGKGARGITDYTYDVMNRMTSRVDVFGKTVGYEYNKNGQIKTLQYPAPHPGDRAVDYEFDKLGRMTKVTDWLDHVTEYHYDSIGNLKRTDNSNGTRVIQAYDPGRRLTDLRNEKSDGSLIAGYHYEYDGAGNITREMRDEPLLPELSAESVHYNYDAADQITSATGSTFRHDLRGNLVYHNMDQPTSYTFNYANRLTRIDRPDAVWTYDYEDSGNRISRTQDGNTEYFTLDVNQRLVSVLSDNNTSGSEQAYYVYGFGLISKIVNDSQNQVYHYNNLGSTIALSDDVQNVLDKFIYNEYGHLIKRFGNVDQSFLYIGRLGARFESNSLIFMRSRYYNSMFDRFLSKDPENETTNAYQYCRNEPVNNIDPTGMATFNDAIDELYTRISGDKTSIMDQLRGSLIKGIILQGIPKYITLPIGFLTNVPTVGETEGDPYWLPPNAARTIIYAHEKIPAKFGKMTPISIGFNVQNQTSAAVGEGGGGAGYDVSADISNVQSNENPSYDWTAWEERWYAHSQGSQSTTLLSSKPGYKIVADENRNSITYRQVTIETPKTDWAAIDASLNAQANWLNEQRNVMIAQYEKQEAQVRSQMDAFTGGRGWESMGGQHGETWSAVDIMGMSRTYLTGFWYSNVSQCVNNYVPAPDITPWLSAHAALRQSVAQRVAGQFGPNGTNTPWLPEVYEAYVIDGKLAVYGK